MKKIIIILVLIAIVLCFFTGSIEYKDKKEIQEFDMENKNKVITNNY